MDGWFFIPTSSPCIPDGENLNIAFYGIEVDERRIIGYHKYHFNLNNEFKKRLDFM